MDKQAKSFIRIAIFAFAALIATTLSFYFINVSGPLSSDNSDWGTFGDYVGGVLNPFIALLNVAAFVYLTYVIEMQQARHEKRQMLMPFLVNAMNEMVKFETMALSIVANVPMPHGTIADFEIRASQFELRYSAYLKRAGVETEQIARVFKALRDVKHGAFKNMMGQELESVVDKQQRTEIGVIALVMRAQLEILEQYVMD